MSGLLLLRACVSVDRATRKSQIGVAYRILVSDCNNCTYRDLRKLRRYRIASKMPVQLLEKWYTLMRRRYTRWHRGTALEAVSCVSPNRYVRFEHNVRTNDKPAVY